jgi:hypothetical protein
MKMKSITLLEASGVEQGLLTDACMKRAVANLRRNGWSEGRFGSARDTMRSGVSIQPLRPKSGGWVHGIQSPHHMRCHPNFPAYPPSFFSSVQTYTPCGSLAACVLDSVNNLAPRLIKLFKECYCTLQTG